MSEKYKTITAEIYFVTLTVVGWIDIFTKRMYCELLIDNLNFCIKNKGLTIYAYCIMPSHLHMIASSKYKPLSHLLRDLKSFTAKKIIHVIKNDPVESRKEWLLHLFGYFGKYKSSIKEFQFWKHSNHPICLDNNIWFDQKLEYIHQNPVEAGIVDETEHYIYCSSNPNQRVLLEAIE